MANANADPRKLTSRPFRAPAQRGRVTAQCGDDDLDDEQAQAQHAGDCGGSGHLVASVGELQVERGGVVDLLPEPRVAPVAAVPK